MEDDNKTKEESLLEMRDLQQHHSGPHATTAKGSPQQVYPLCGETFFRSLIENSLDIITVLDADGLYLYQSPNLEQVLGYKPEELIGKSAFDYINHEDLAAVMDAFNFGVSHPGASRSAEYRFRAKDGSWRHFESVGKMLPPNVGISGVVINSRDITDRKHAEELLLKSERRLRRAEEVANFGNWEFLMDDKVVLASDGAKTIYGLKGSEWQIPDVQAIPLPEYRTMLDIALTELIEKGKPYNVEFKIRRPADGRIIDIQSLAEYDSANRIVFGVVQDITERTRTEEARRVAEKTFRNLLETIQLVAILLDRDGNMTFCNDYLLNLTGWGKKEVFGQNWQNLLIPQEEKEHMNTIFSSVIRGEKVNLHDESLIVTRTGKELLISWNNTVLHDLEGKIAGMASIGIDITAHRSLEAQLRQAQKMEAVGILAGGIAHDFNNILTTIMGYGHIVRSKLNDNDPMASSVEQILEAADRAAQLTRSLLAFSRKQILNLKPVKINDIISRFATFVSRLIGDDIEISTPLAPDEIVINADSVQIDQVLMNLATNAKDAMPNGGCFTISTRLVESNDENFILAHPDAQPGMFVHISVSDTGEGMTTEEIGKIFDPFFTTKDIGKGTGLGLAMVYSIIDQHNGYLNVTSAPGKGSNFNIYLPIHRQGTETYEMRTAESLVLAGSETILVAEDDKKLRTLAEIILKQHGYHVILAEDGEDAISKFMTHKDEIQLVILDMIMPKKSGIQVDNEIKKIKPDIKSFFASGYTADKIVGTDTCDKELELIMKPWSPKALLRKVREVLNKK